MSIRNPLTQNPTFYHFIDKHYLNSKYSISESDPIHIPFELAKFFLGYFYTHFGFLSTPLFTFVNGLFHNCKFGQLNGLWGCLRYPHFVRNPLRLRGLGCGKINLYIWKIFRNFGEWRAGYAFPILYYMFK